MHQTRTKKCFIAHVFVLCFTSEALCTLSQRRFPCKLCAAIRKRVSSTCLAHLSLSVQSMCFLSSHSRLVQTGARLVSQRFFKPLNTKTNSDVNMISTNVPFRCKCKHLHDNTPAAVAGACSAQGSGFCRQEVLSAAHWDNGILTHECVVIM